MYNSHHDSILALNCEAHLNTTFAHFWCFGTTFDLLDRKEVDCLKEMVESDPGLAAMIS
jgi:hypothetical protein